MRTSVLSVQFVPSVFKDFRVFRCREEIPPFSVDFRYTKYLCLGKTHTEADDELDKHSVLGEGCSDGSSNFGCLKSSAIETLYSLPMEEAF